MITYKIYGMHSRDNLILSEKEKLNLSDNDIYYDDRLQGGLALYTAKKAWLAPISECETHRVVFPDDIETCNGFKDICEIIAETHPNVIVSFILWDGMVKDERLERLTSVSPYVHASNIIGMGIMMPVQYIEPCFAYIKNVYNDNIADDIGMERWARNYKIPVIGTIPSLVQHLGDDSILNPDNPIRRTVYYSKNPQADWRSKKIISLTPERFKPNPMAVIRCAKKS